MPYLLTASFKEELELAGTTNLPVIMDKSDKTSSTVAPEAPVRGIVVLKASESIIDVRSRTRAVSLEIKNDGETTVLIKAIDVDPPEGVVVQKTIGDGLRLSETIAQLRREISLVLTDAVHFSFKSVEGMRLNSAEMFVRQLGERYAGPLGILRVISDTTYGRSALKQFIRKNWAERHHALDINVSSSEEAESECERWSILEPEVRSILAFKISQLKKCEEVLLRGKKPDLISLPPHSAFDRTYVLTTPQNPLEGRLHGLHFRVSTIDGDTQTLHQTAYTLVTSANPIVLSFIATAFSILSSVIYHLGSASVGDARSLLIVAAKSGLIGFVAMQVFERLYEKPDFETRLGWRSAVIVGSIAGLFTDNLLGALKGFIAT